MKNRNQLQSYEMPWSSNVLDFSATKNLKLPGKPNVPFFLGNWIAGFRGKVDGN